MEKRYLSWKEAKEYTSMGDLELELLLENNNVCIYQRDRWCPKFVDKQDIDKTFNKGKKKNNYFKNRW